MNKNKNKKSLKNPMQKKMENMGTLYTMFRNIALSTFYTKDRFIKTMSF